MSPSLDVVPYGPLTKKVYFYLTSFQEVFLKQTIKLEDMIFIINDYGFNYNFPVLKKSLINVLKHVELYINIYNIDSKTRFNKFNAINDIFKYNYVSLPKNNHKRSLTDVLTWSRRPGMYMRTKSVSWDRELGKLEYKAFFFFKIVSSQ